MLSMRVARSGRLRRCLSLDISHCQPHTQVVVVSAGYFIARTREIDREVREVMVRAGQLGSRGMECSEAERLFCSGKRTSLQVPKCNLHWFKYA
jgi:hypothetical protein